MYNNRLVSRKLAWAKIKINTFYFSFIVFFMWWMRDSRKEKKSEVNPMWNSGSIHSRHKPTSISMTIWFKTNLPFYSSLTQNISFSLSFWYCKSQGQRHQENLPTEQTQKHPTVVRSKRFRPMTTPNGKQHKPFPSPFSYYYIDYTSRLNQHNT